MSLTSVTLPNSVSSIGNGAFYGCNGLTQILVEAGSKYFTSVEGVLYNKDVTELLICPGGKKEISIPTSVSSIFYWAFGGCNGLTSITLPTSVTSICGSAFAGCSGLTQILVETGSKYFTSVEGVLYNKDVTELIVCPGGKKEISIPISVTSIAEDAFCYCDGLSSITLPSSVNYIGDGAFYNCSGLTSITLPNSITSIGKYVFNGCSSLTSVTLPDSITSIKEGAFYRCTGLTAVTLPNSVTSIGDYAFFFCRDLMSITLPNSVTSIGSWAFDGCDSIANVFYPTKFPITAASDIFSYNSYEKAVLWVPEGATVNYQSTNPWNNFVNIREYDFSDIKEIVNFDISLPFEVYTINGVKIGYGIEGLSNGIYIIRQGNLTKKIAIR